MCAAELHYQVGTDPTNMTFTTVTMTNTSGDAYTATIPAQSDGSFVRYYLSATDDSSNTTSVPNSDPPSKSGTGSEAEQESETKTETENFN